MLRIILIDERYLDTCDVGALKDALGFRIVLITELEETDSLKEQFGFLDEIYKVHSHDTKRLRWDFDEAEVKAIVKQEQSLMHAGDTLKVLSINEYYQALAATIRNSFSLPGTSCEMVSRFTDKIVMKEIIQNAGIRVPRFQHFDLQRYQNACDDYFDALAQELGLPFILKPISEASAYGITRVCSKKDFVNQSVREDVLLLKYEVEEFIAGPLFHCNALVHEGEIIFSECSEYSYPMLEFMYGRVLASMPLDEAHADREPLIAFSKKVLVALGMPDGVFHMEIFKDLKDEYVFLEVASRPPGGMVVSTYQRYFGVNLVRQALRMAFGYQPDVEIKRGDAGLWAHVPIGVGLRRSAYPLPRLEATSEITWQLPDDETPAQSAGKSLSDTAAIISAWGQYAVVSEDFRRLKQVVIRDKQDEALEGKEPNAHQRP